MSPPPPRSPQHAPPSHPPLTQPPHHPAIPHPPPQQPPSVPPSRPRPPHRQNHPSASPSPSNQTSATRGRTLTYEDLAKCFHLPINTAARELGVCVTALKKQCRKHGVPRWPHRKLKSLDKLKEKLEKEEATAADKEYYKHEIHSIVQKKDHIFRTSPTLREHVASRDRTDTQKQPPPSSSDQAVQNRFAQEQSQPQHPQQQPIFISNPVPLPGRAPGMPASHPSHPGATLAAQPVGVFPISSHVSLCGIVGCDCYANGGESSQNYHVPFHPSRLPPQVAPANAQANVSSALPSNAVPFYSPVHPQYAYPPHLAYPTPPQHPFHNMVQVNVVEQQAYQHHHANGASSAQHQASSAPPTHAVVAAGTSASPNVIQGGSVTPARSAPSDAGTSVTNPSYEVYASAQGAPVGQPANGYLYPAFPPQNTVGIEGMLQASSSSGPQAPVVPHYWTDMGHSSNASNLVTMYNQTTHYHHHHAAESGKGHSTGTGAMGGTTSSATNNSDAGESRRAGARRVNDNATSQPTTAGMYPQSVASIGMHTSRSAVPGEKAPSIPATGDACVPTGHSRPKTNGVVEKREEIPLRAKTTLNREHPFATQANRAAKQGGTSEAQIKAHSAKNDRSSIGQLPRPDDPRHASVPRRTEGDDEHRSDALQNSSRRRVERTENMGAHDRTVLGAVRNGEMRASGGQRIEVVDSPSRKASPEAMRARVENVNGKDDDGKQPKDDSRTGMGRSPNKRPRNSVVGNQMNGNSNWAPSYIGAGNTGVPVMLHGEREVASRMREITPPSDREETPEGADVGDGSGSGTGSGDGTGSGSGRDGTGSGSGDGTGSGSGDGSGPGSGAGSGDSDGSKDVEEERRIMRNNSRARLSIDPPSPGVAGSSKRRKMGSHPGVKSWRMGSVLENGSNNGGGGKALGDSERNGSSLNSPGSPMANATLARARRHENLSHQSHQCLSSAQWCTDKNFRVTFSSGSRLLLGLAGIISNGRTLMEGGEGAIEDLPATRMRYGSALKGHRVEWMLTHGRKNYVMILAPFRKRGGGEITGVAGLLVEVTLRLMSAK